MKNALVIHPILSFYAGGEFLCLNVCEALQEMGYHVFLACDVFRPSDLERMYGLGRVMEKCEHVAIPRFSPRFKHFTSLQKLPYARHVLPMFKDIDADVVFSTQSSPFTVASRILHFVYNVADVFGYPPAAAPPKFPRSSNHLRQLYYCALGQSKNLVWKKRAKSRDWFFAIGSRVLRDLKTKGYSNASFAFPPCRVDFKPRFPKLQQVVQAARLVPEKRLELYFDVASRLPGYKFFLLGIDTPLLRKSYPGYSQRLLSRLPRNVTYVESPLRDRPDLLEQSKVYMYTGVEDGIVLTMVEAIAAGCLPFSCSDVGAVDVLKACEVGETYNSPEEAATKIRACLESETSNDEVLEISTKAERLSPQAFKHWMKKIVQERNMGSDFGSPSTDITV